MSSIVQTFRDTMRRISPPWLQNGNAERYLYAMAVQVDVLGEALIASLKLRFPGLYSEESLPLIGRERRIARGPNEPAASYATRLLRWLDDHQRRGGPHAMLAQLYAYYAPDNFPVELVYRNGRRFALATDGTITQDDIPFPVDTAPEQWARWWLFCYLTPGAAVPPLTEAELASYRLVPREWNAGHCLGTIVLFEPGGELWNYPQGHVWNEPGLWNVPGATTYPVD